MLPARWGHPGRGRAAMLSAAALAAAVLVAIAGSSWGALAHHGPAGGHAAHAAPALAGAVWLVGWGLMVAATMLPATAPLAGRATSPGLVAAGFLAAWSALGLVVLAGVVALGATAASGAIVAGLGLLAAGAFQLSPAKARALARCRDHGRLLAGRSADPRGDAVRGGVAQGRASVACCGPLMAAMALGAVGGTGAMLLAGAVMTTEAAAPWGARLTRPLGAALLVAGALVLAG